MAEFPNIEDLFTLDPTFTQAHARPMMEQWQRATMQLPGGRPPARLAIENDALRPTQSAHIVDTEGESPADDVQTIVTTNIHDGCILELLAADIGRIVTLKHNPSQLNGIALAGGSDKALDTVRPVRLQRAGDFWQERPLGANLSDALDGTRQAADGVAASEWALAQVNDKAEGAAGEAATARAEAEAAMAAAKPQKHYRVVVESSGNWTPQYPDGTPWADGVSAMVRILGIGGGGKGGGAGSGSGSGGQGGGKGGDTTVSLGGVELLRASGGSGGAAPASTSGGGGGGAGKEAEVWVRLTAADVLAMVVGAGAVATSASKNGEGPEAGLSPAAQYGGCGAAGAGDGGDRKRVDTTYVYGRGGQGGLGRTGYGNGGGGAASGGGDGPAPGGNAGTGAQKGPDGAATIREGGNGGPGAIIIEY